MGIKKVPRPPYRLDLAPWDFWLFLKLKGCRNETTEGIKRDCDKGHRHAHIRGIPWGLPGVVGSVQVHCSRRRLLRRGLEFHVCTINKSAHTKKVWKLIVSTSYNPCWMSCKNVFGISFSKRQYDFKTICIYENLPISAYFFERREDFSNIIPHAKHVLNTFKLRTHVCIFSVVYILFAFVISTRIHCCVNNSYDIKVLMKFIKTETFNVGFVSQWIHLITMNSSNNTVSVAQGVTRLELPKLCYHPGWRLMRLGYRTCFHTLYDEKKIIWVILFFDFLHTRHSNETIFFCSLVV